MISQPTFERTSRIIVLHAVTDQRAAIAVIKLERDANLNFALGGQEKLSSAIGQIEMVGRFVKILGRRFLCVHSVIAFSVRSGAGAR